MTDGVRRLNHEEAEMLISARMDEQLERADSRALLVHLQTCESCRAFAVQSEVLGRELNALPVLPPSAIVDRQLRQTFEKGRGRWSLAALMPATGGNGGLRVAVGALAMLTLISVFLLVRMAGNQSGEGPAIEAPNGGVAQQLDRSPTEESTLLGQAPEPTETARVVVPMTAEADSTDVAAPSQVPGSTKTASEPTEPATESVSVASDPTEAAVEPTQTLDSSFVYTIEPTETPAASDEPTQTPAIDTPEATDTPGDVSIASLPVDDATPAASIEANDSEGDVSPVSESPPATPTSEPSPEATETRVAPVDEEPTVEATLPSDVPEDESEAPVTEVAAPATTIPEPTATATPIEIAVEDTEVPVEPTSPPPAEATTEVIQIESPEGSPSPASEPVSEPTLTPTPQPPTPTETPPEPFSQPTIAPMAGQTSGDQGTGESASTTGDQSPQIQPSGDTNTDDGGEGNASSATQVGPDDAPSDTGSGDPSIDASGGDLSTDEGGSPPIVPSDGTNIPDGVGGAAASGSGDQSSGNEEPAPIPTVDDSVEPFGLDLSDTVTGLPQGTTSPAGRLEFSPGMNLYSVIAPDGQLAIANLEGELVVTLGAGELPVWSGSGLMFASPGDTGSIIGIWNSDSGDLSYVPPSDNEASNDVPIGGDGSGFYFLRTYPESGIIEIRSATIDGSDNGVLWTSDAVALGGARPAWAPEGVYLPTESEWLFIDWDGNVSSLGENPYGYVGAPVLSPGGGLMTYSAGDQVIVAWSVTPGSAVATTPFVAGGGYAFATTGEEIVVSDGSSLRVVSYLGDDLGTLDGSQPIGAVYWISDTIYYIQIGEDAALKSTSLGAIQSD